MLRLFSHSLKFGRTKPYYNYIKFKDGNFVRYCFINKIQLKNGCVYVNYKEDIWSSYGGKIKGLLPSYLTNSRVKGYRNFNPKIIKLPFEYDGNNPLKVVENLTYNKCYCILELQTFNLVSGETVAQRREVEYVVMCTASLSPSSMSDIVLDDLEFELADILDALRVFGNYISASTETMWVIINNTLVHRFFEIGDVYIVPNTFDIRSLIGLNNGDIINAQEYAYFGTSDITNKPGEYLLKFKDNTKNKLNLVQTKTFLNNYKRFSIGTFTNQIKTENNGTLIDAKVYFSPSMSNISIKLNIQNQLYDITEDFKYEFPFDNVLSDATAQRKISLQLQNRNVDYGMNKEIMGIYKGSNYLIGGIGKAIAGGYSGHYGQMIGGIEQSVSSLGDIGFSIYGYDKLSGDKLLINAPMYSNSKGVFSNSKCFLNCRVGIFSCEIDADNDDFVKLNINNFGHRVYEFITNLLELDINSTSYWKGLSVNYNVLKFDGINLYGSFTREIAIQLNKIFTDGGKIWYEPLMTEDNYII